MRGFASDSLPVSMYRPFCNDSLVAWADVTICEWMGRPETCGFWAASYSLRAGCLLSSFISVSSFSLCSLLCRQNLLLAWLGLLSSDYCKNLRIRFFSAPSRRFFNYPDVFFNSPQINRFYLMGARCCNPFRTEIVFIRHRDNCIKQSSQTQKYCLVTV